MKILNWYLSSRPQQEIDSLSKSVKEIRQVSKWVNYFWNYEFQVHTKLVAGSYKGYEIPLHSINGFYTGCKIQAGSYKHEWTCKHGKNFLDPPDKNRFPSDLDVSYLQPNPVHDENSFYLVNADSISLHNRLLITVDRLNELDTREAKSLAKNLKAYLKKFSQSKNDWYLYKAVEFAIKYQEFSLSRIDSALYRRKQLFKTKSKRFIRDLRDSFRRVIWFLFKNMDSEGHLNVCNSRKKQALYHLSYHFVYEQKISYRTFKGHC